MHLKNRLNEGLYRAENEHDACGVGMIVNIHGNKSHELVDSALKVLENMKHRGAEGAEGRRPGLIAGSSVQGFRKEILVPAAGTGCAGFFYVSSGPAL